MLDPTRLTAQYEALRARVVGDPVLGRPAHGLALLLRSGLPAWLAQMQRPRTDLEHLPGGRRGDAPPAQEPIGDAATATTILILASMVLAAHEERSDDHLP